MTSSVEQSAYKVEFAGVGRDNRSWTSALQQQPTEAILERLVRKHGGLASREIECVFDEDMEHGTIIVGGYRPVGAFRVIEPKP
jgi:hypothetical protein